MALLFQVDWVELLRTGGVASIVIVLGVIGVIAAARWFKSTMESTLADARKERDAMRVLNEQQAREHRQFLEAQSNKFLESLRIRDDIQEKGLDEILRELRNNPRRK